MSVFLGALPLPILGEIHAKKSQLLSQFSGCFFNAIINLAKLEHQDRADSRIATKSCCKNKPSAYARDRPTISRTKPEVTLEISYYAL